MGVPNNIIVPFVGVEFDNSRASKAPAVLNFQTLIFGQKTSSGSGTSGQILKISTADEVGALSGFGSQIHQIAKSYFLNNKVTDTFICMLDDADAGVAASFSITVTALSVKSGELDVYIDGYRIPVIINDSDSDETIAESIANALSDVEIFLPVTNKDSALGVVTFDAKNAGTVANTLDIRFAYYDGEVIPEGVTLEVDTEVSGAGDVDITPMISAMGEEWYNVLIGPYTDSANLEILETELLDRFGVLRQNDGIYITARKGTDSSLIAYATDSQRNSHSVGTVACDKYPSSIEQIAGAVGGQFASSAANDAAKPLHRLSLSGILPPRKEDRSKLLARNSLARNGLITLNPGNGVQTEATVTMYLKNSSGVADTSYQQLNALFTLMVLRYRFNSQILSKYPRAKLADNADNIGPGQQIITPAIGKAEAIIWFRQAETDGLVENFDQFKREVTCYRDPSNRKKLLWGLPPDLMNQFIVGSADMQFID